MAADGMERFDEDESAVTGDTRIRVESGENGTYVLRREKYTLVEFDPYGDGDEDGPYERYDWHPVEKFVLQGDSEAKQSASMLSKEGAFDPNVLFFRQFDPETIRESATDPEGGAADGE